MAELGKRERNRIERQEALKSAGLDLFLTRGIEPVTIDELAKAGGMAKGNFYRYFADKGALVDSILAPVASEARTVIRRCAIGVGRSQNTAELSAAYAMMALELVRIGLTQRGVVQLYLQENRTPVTASTSCVRELNSELRSGAIHLTEVAIEHKLLNVTDARVSALAVIGAIEQLALAVIRDGLDAPPEEIARIVVTMIMDGIRA